MIEKCPYSDDNSCEQYRLQEQRCQSCPLVFGILDDEKDHWDRRKRCDVVLMQPTGVQQWCILGAKFIAE